MDTTSTFSAAPAANAGGEPTESIERVTLADYIYPAIQKQYIAIVTHEADVRETGEIEAVHQMRVSLRRLRSMIQAFAPIIDVPKVMGDKQIGKIAKILGKVRDLDVLQDTCTTYHANLPTAEQEHLAEVITKIGKRRRKSLIKAQMMLADRDYRSFKLALNTWLNHPRYTPAIDVSIESILPDLLLSVVSDLFLNPGWWVAIDPSVESELAVTQVLQTQGHFLHSLRKQIKATRYLLELFPDRYSPLYNNYLKDFKQIHQLLGNIQDGVVLDDFIARVLGKRATTKLPNMYAQIDRRKYETWQNWQPIQHRYQQLSTKQELRSLLMEVTIHNS
jgi:CHAD domain-containing protein